MGQETHCQHCREHRHPKPVGYHDQLNVKWVSQRSKNDVLTHTLEIRPILCLSPRDTIHRVVKNISKKSDYGVANRLYLPESKERMWCIQFYARINNSVTSICISSNLTYNTGAAYIKAAWATHIAGFGVGLSCSPANARRQYERHEMIQDTQKLYHVGYRFTLCTNRAVSINRVKPTAPTSWRPMNARKVRMFGTRWDRAESPESSEIQTLFARECQPGAISKVEI